MAVIREPTFRIGPGGRGGRLTAVVLTLWLGILPVPGGGLLGEASARDWQPAYVHGDETEETAALRDRLTRLYDSHRPPAMQVAIISEGRKVEFGFGQSDRKSGTALRQDHVFRFGSVTKLLVASAMLRALEAQQIPLDEPIAGRFVDRSLPADLTYRRLLQHTSGLPDILDSRSFGEALESDPSRVWTADELWSVAAALPVRSEPWRYANTNFNLIGELLQQMQGAAWEKATIEAVGAPSLIVPAREGGASVVLGYDKACLIVRCFWRPASSYDPSAFFAAGALGGTAGALADAGDRVFGGLVFGSEARQSMLSFVDVSLEPYAEIMSGYGLGVMRFRSEGVEIWGHTGDVPGFSAILLHRHDRQLTVAILTNASSGSPAFYRDAIAAVAR